MAETSNSGGGFRAWRPSKTLWFWSVAGAVVATIVLGFTVGGWVGPGTADRTAEEAATQARAELAATVCVDRFLEATDARRQLATLKETSSWQRDDFIEKGGWTTLRGMKEPIEAAAELCAERLMQAELPPANEAVEATENGA